MILQGLKLLPNNKYSRDNKHFGGKYFEECWSPGGEYNGVLPDFCICKRFPDHLWVETRIERNSYG
jgi:hypothetical protein